jgi:di/tricarboxylate transporter
MAIRIKSGMNPKRIQKGLREWVQKRDRELLTLLIIYVTIILWILNFNI